MWGKKYFVNVIEYFLWPTSYAAIFLIIFTLGPAVTSLIILAVMLCVVGSFKLVRNVMLSALGYYTKQLENACD